MRARCFLIPCALAAALTAGSSVAAQDTAGGDASRTRTFRVRGLVMDSGRAPIRDVEIIALDSVGTPGRSTSTDEEGRFDFGPFRQGALVVRARRLGYEQQTLELQVGQRGQSPQFEIILVAVPGELEQINVSAPSAPTKLRGYYERSRQKRTFGKFIDEEGIRRLNPRTSSELFRGVPGVTLTSNQSGGNIIRIRGCQPMVWLDDQRIPGTELDDLISPSEIAAIEFYASNAGIPARYLDRGNRLCGLILVWTKSGI